MTPPVREVGLTQLAGRCADQLRARGFEARVEIVDPLEIFELPLRWQLTERDRTNRDAVAAGKRIATVA